MIIRNCMLWTIFFLIHTKPNLGSALESIRILSYPPIYIRKTLSKNILISSPFKHKREWPLSSLYHYYVGSAWKPYISRSGWGQHHMRKLLILEDFPYKNGSICQILKSYSWFLSPSRFDIVRWVIKLFIIFLLSLHSAQ